MLHSDRFQTTVFNYDDKTLKMDYDFRITPEGCDVGFGNIYFKGEDEAPSEFTFFTIKGRNAGYTPMNGTKELYCRHSRTVTGKKLPVDSML